MKQNKKNNYSIDSYVKQNLKVKDLCMLLRSGTLLLAIETGRFNGLPEQKKPYCYVSY